MSLELISLRNGKTLRLEHYEAPKEGQTFDGVMCGYWEPNTENHDFGKLVKDSSAQGRKVVHLRMNYTGLVKAHFHSNQFSLNPNFFFKFSEQVCLHGTLANP